MVLTQARVCPARASVPECGPWRPGNGHVDRAVWARYEELLPVYRKRGSIVGDPSGGQLRAVLVAIWATGGKRALFRTGQGSVLASCFASHGEPCGTSALLDPAVEEGLSGHLRRLSRAALAGRPPPPLPTAVPEAPPAGLVAWARRVSGCGEGTAVVPPAPAAAHTFGNPDYADGISPSVRKPSPPVASRPGSSALGPAIPSGDLVLTAHRMSEALDARYPWRNGPSGRTRSLPRNADLLLSGRVERSVEGRSPPQVVRLQPSAFEEVTRLEARRAQGLRYAELSPRHPLLSAAAVEVGMWVGEEPGAFPWSQLEAAREHLTAMPRGKVEAHLHARGSHRPAAGVPLAGGTGTAGPGASVAAPVPANYEVRRSDEIRRMQDYERGLDRRISGSRD